MSQASTSLVSTPVRSLQAFATKPTKTITPETKVPPSPGTFRHPRLTEIIQRQSASSLTSRRVQNAAVNFACLLLTFFIGGTIHNILTTAFALTGVPHDSFDPSTALLILRVYLCLNLALSLRPVLPYISQTDDVTDIPLTPTQRALLGLPPSHQASPTASIGGSGYITPPRYKRDGGSKAATSPRNSPTAFSSGARSTSANYSASPLSTSRYTVGFSPSPQVRGNIQSSQNYRHTSASPFVASPGGSPLSHYTMANDFDQSTFTTVNGRASFGASTSTSGFGLGRSQSMRERRSAFDESDNTPSTPSPSGPKRKPGINYKWLYDKGARLPKSESMGF